MMVEESPKPGKKVIVGMSGGVDSSVAAALLLEAGYRVEGVMLHLWAEPGAKSNACCSLEAQNDAAEVARILGIPFRVLDVAELFRRKVVEYFIEAYTSGRTPNPCLVCNREVRFGFLLEYALRHGAEHLATGHYARIERTEEGEYRLLKGLDDRKDQSYVLYTMTQFRLAHTLFPIGEHTKDEIREMARKLGLPVAEKPESQDLCFAADGDYRGFLRRHAADRLKPGPILDTEGNVLGEHRGLAFYTIGQRHGLKIQSTEPLYVVEIDAVHNRLIVGTKDKLGKSHLLAEEVHRISGRSPSSPLKSQVKIRYKAVPKEAEVIPKPGGKVEVHFREKLRDITPGQAAVFYQGEVCLGGGIITKAW